ncbi:TetR/AcrR family transcriptional regulator [uncultured Psychroserpens sp.]|uniref:TetR/AcrR family transcriptional regulator n=1 Tax=uncultured Psychroserpens sp. TaxID=255436 RepID=UPI00261E1189|nr:TetR/AcrR family transcriptional regulator [uncultured Psychroserpens sp.]
MGYKHNKEDILDVGQDVFRRNGYHNVGINQILKEAGIPKGSFYNFFESKEDFAQQVVKRYGMNNKNWIQSFFDDSELSPVESLKSFYAMLIDMNEEDEYAGGCLVNNLSVEVGRNNDALAVEANQCFLSWMDVFGSVILKGQDLGEITQNFSETEIAEYLHAGFFGVLARVKVTRNRMYMDSWLDMTFNFIRA